MWEEQQWWAAVARIHERRSISVWANLWWRAGRHGKAESERAGLQTQDARMLGPVQRRGLQLAGPLRLVGIALFSVKRERWWYGCVRP